MTNVWQVNVRTTSDLSCERLQMRATRRTRRNSKADAHFSKAIAHLNVGTREQIEELRPEPMPDVSYNRCVAVWRDGKWVRARRVSSSRMCSHISWGH